MSVARCRARDLGSSLRTSTSSSSMLIAVISRHEVRHSGRFTSMDTYQTDRYNWVYPGFPTLFWGLSVFFVGDLMGKALWKLVENAARFPRRGGRVLCVHGAVSFHRARPCGPRWLPGRGAMRDVELDRRVLGLQSTGEYLCSRQNRRPVQANARLTTERQGYQVLTPFGKLGYSHTIHRLAEVTMARSPGTRIVFSSNRNGVEDLYERTAGGVAATLLYESTDRNNPTGFSPDGSVLLFRSGQRIGEIWALPAVGDREPVPLVQTGFPAGHAVFSPDGRWFAYCEGDSGSDQVYIQPYPPDGSRERLSTTNGSSPQWSANGEVFYVDVGEPGDGG